MAGHLPVRNACFLCPCLACILPSLPRAQPCQRLQHFTSRVCLFPAPGQLERYKSGNVLSLLSFTGRLLPWFLLCWTEARAEQAWFFLPTCPFVPRMDNLLSVIRSRDWGVGGFSLYPGLAWSLPTVTSCCPSTPSWEHIQWGAGRALDACVPSHLLYLIPLALTHPPPCGKAQHPRAGASSSEEPTTPFPTVYPSLQDQSGKKYWSPWDGARKERTTVIGIFKMWKLVNSPVHDVVGVESDFYIEMNFFFNSLLCKLCALSIWEMVWGGYSSV